MGVSLRKAPTKSAVLLSVEKLSTTRMPASWDSVMAPSPSSEGGIDDGGAASVRAIMHWQYRTICRGSNSILQNLYDVVGSKALDYISFYGLRAHGRLGDGGPVVTNQIYVHSKLMIIDDRMTLIGSVNINDRSLLGSRDSELKEITTVHCGFCNENGGFRVFDVDKHYMRSCRVVVATCAFGGGDDLHQPIGMTEVSIKKVCYVAFWDEVTCAAQQEEGNRGWTMPNANKVGPKYSRKL